MSHFLDLGTEYAVHYSTAARGSTGLHPGRIKASSSKRMKLIQPNCRLQFTARDVDFVIRILGAKVGDKDCLVQLLADEESRDAILDDERLFKALLEYRGCLEVSTHFYFYILVRNVLRKSDLEDRVLADYVAEVLAEFSSSMRTECVLSGQKTPLNYFYEMILALQNASERECFELRLHVGNYSLFLAGLFPDRIRHRTERRGFPDLRYYEAMGMTQFRLAGEHRLAQKHRLDSVLCTLAERFHATRKALNDLAARLVSMEDFNYSAHHLLGGPEQADNWAI